MIDLPIGYVPRKYAHNPEPIRRIIVMSAKMVNNFSSGFIIFFLTKLINNIKCEILSFNLEQTVVNYDF